MSADGLRARARELGIVIGAYPPGRWNAITDVAGVEVGHATVSWGDGSEAPGQGPARTGVTVIWPQRDDLVRNPVAAGFFALSGTGEMTARSEIEELGRINTPFALTNTMSVGLVYDAVCRYLVERDPGVGEPEQAGVQIPLVAECDDEWLHDARGFHVTREHVYAALDGAAAGPVAEGCVGSGTGMVCFGFKGGIGTSSRVVPERFGGYTVGVLVMTNFGYRPRLTVAGAPVGQHFSPTRRNLEADDAPRDDGSCIVVVTDAPLDGRQLARVAKRAGLGLGRTGSHGGNGSGELIVAFSTTYRPGEEPGEQTQRVVESHAVDPLFMAAIDATEEAVLNSLCVATTTTGRHGHVIEALPLGRLRELLAQYGVTG